MNRDRIKQFSLAGALATGLGAKFICYSRKVVNAFE